MKVYILRIVPPDGQYYQTKDAYKNYDVAKIEREKLEYKCRQANPRYNVYIDDFEIMEERS